MSPASGDRLDEPTLGSAKKEVSIQLMSPASGDSQAVFHKVAKWYKKEFPFN